MVEVGRDPGGHLVQTRCSSRATDSWLPRTMSRQLLSITNKEDSTNSLRNLRKCSVTLIIKKRFADVQEEPPVFQFAPIASGPVSRYH